MQLQHYESVPFDCLTPSLLHKYLIPASFSKIIENKFLINAL